MSGMMCCIKTGNIQKILGFLLLQFPLINIERRFCNIYNKYNYSQVELSFSIPFFKFAYMALNDVTDYI